MEIARHQVAGVLDLERVAASAAPAFEGHRAVGHGVYGRTFRRGVVDARVRAVDLVDRVFAGVGEFRTDARVFQRGLEHLLAQARAVRLPVLDFAALAERDGVILLAALRELRAPDAPDAHRHRVVDEPLVVDHREVVALLDAEEIHRPLVDVLQFGGQSVGQLLLHDRAPERGVDHGAFLRAAQRVGLGVLAHGDRVVVESEDHIVGDRYFIGEVVEMGCVERILVDKGRVLVPGADVAQREHLLRGFVQPVDREGRHAESVEYFPQRFAASDLPGLGAVIVGIDAVEHVVRLLCVLHFHRRTLGPVAGACRCEQQGAYRYFQTVHKMKTKIVQAGRKCKLVCNFPSRRLYKALPKIVQAGRNAKFFFADRLSSCGADTRAVGYSYSAPSDNAAV